MGFVVEARGEKKDNEQGGVLEQVDFRTHVVAGETEPSSYVEYFEGMFDGLISLASQYLCYHQFYFVFDSW